MLGLQQPNGSNANDKVKKEHILMITAKNFMAQHYSIIIPALIITILVLIIQCFWYHSGAQQIQVNYVNEFKEMHKAHEKEQQEIIKQMVELSEKQKEDVDLMEEQGQMISEQLHTFKAWAIQKNLLTAANVEKLQEDQKNHDLADHALVSKHQQILLSESVLPFSSSSSRQSSPSDANVNLPDSGVQLPPPPPTLAGPSGTPSAESFNMNQVTRETAPSGTPILVFSAHRGPSLDKTIESILKVRPSKALFPIFISQDGAQATVSTVINKYVSAQVAFHLRYNQLVINLLELFNKL
jgi:hypothetical protein